MPYIWWIWRSWLARQIVALEVKGSTPFIHPILTNTGIRLMPYARYHLLRCRQAVRHGILIPASVGSNPATSAKKRRFLTVFFI